MQPGYRPAAWLKLFFEGRPQKEAAQSTFRHFRWGFARISLTLWAYRRLVLPDSR